MAIDPVMGAIVRHWGSVECQLTVEDGRRLRELLMRYYAEDATAGERLDATEEMAEILSLALPDDHPVRRALADPAIVRSAGPLELDEQLMEELRQILDAEGTGPSGALSPADIGRDAMARLATAPALSAADLRRRGGDPGQEYLIRLDGSDGPRFPLFQFDSAGRPYRLVLSINALLDADTDPWGVADWWLGPHAWLDGTPAESIGQVADDVLLATAQAMVEAG